MKKDIVKADLKGGTRRQARTGGVKRGRGGGGGHH